MFSKTPCPERQAFIERLLQDHQKVVLFALEKYYANLTETHREASRALPDSIRIYTEVFLEGLKNL